VVATPIGNLEDITLRALRVLGEVGLVAAEDTRRTGNLMRHYAIATPLVSLHEHNEHRRRAELLRKLQDGTSIALVSDAGTPGIADPGAELISSVRAAGVRVEPVPGPSAITTVLSASGLPLDRFAFAGFPPVRSKDRKSWFKWVASLPDVPVVCFEAPHRIQSTLAECDSLLVNRQIMLAREVTKIHEEWMIGSPKELSSRLSPPRGEFIFVVLARDEPASSEIPPEDAVIADVFCETTKKGARSRREAIRATAEQLGIHPKAVFAALERAKPSE
jgi:16S rRNA (cytidine1402-2'-O)-methyltransferase